MEAVVVWYSANSNSHILTLGDGSWVVLDGIKFDRSIICFVFMALCTFDKRKIRWKLKIGNYLDVLMIIAV